MRAIPCALIRGGTSRGAFFHRDDLPADPAERDVVLLAAMGGPDALQVDGIGGGHPLTSKVAVISRSTDAEADVDYLFLQVAPLDQTVSDAQNCGNLLAGVGVYALEYGLVSARAERTTVRVRMVNTGALCHLELPTPGGQFQVVGDTSIDGVPGTAAPILCNYLDIAGSSCGVTLPTGRSVDVVDGIRMTCVDNGMPVVVMNAADLGVRGTETPDALDANQALKTQLESIRLQIGSKMNLGDVVKKSVPKLCLVSPAQRGGLVMTRTFIPHVCHKTIGVLGAVSTATACLVPDSAVADIANVVEGNPKRLDVEHPGGAFRVELGLDADQQVNKAGVVRTARLLFKGEVMI